MNRINKQIERVAKKHFSSGEVDSELTGFLLAISELFEEREKERSVVHDSMKYMSEELQDMNEKLREELFKNKLMKQEAETGLVRLKALFDTVPEAMMSFYSGGAPRSINQSGLSIIGVDEETFLSNSSEENLDLWLSVIKKPEEFREALKKIVIDNTLTLSGCVEMKDKRIFQYYGVPEFLKGEYIGRSWCWQDITEVMRHQETLEYQAYHDSLTRLPNRESLFKSLEKMLAKAGETESFVSIMFIDIDNFKNVNDFAGHVVGDQIIRVVADRLKSSIDEKEILGRLGGDEFLIIVEGLLGEGKDDIRNTIKQVFKKPISCNDHSYSVTCSVGISVYPYDGLNSNELIRKADMAMYQAKHAGKNTVQYFDEKLEQVAIERIRFESKLKLAIEEGEFNLVYQPKVSLVDQNIFGVEALIRWVDSDGNQISPEVFIGVAESLGMIGQITKWVIKEAYCTMKKWKGTDLENLRMSVNITPHDLQRSTFSEFVLDLFDGQELGASNLEVELTESVLIDQSKKTKMNLKLLRQAGVTLAIDDFGTGYSNFTYLQELNADYLKIDRSIITGIDSSEKRAAIARSIIDVGHNLGMEVIAEGIETLAENTCLRSLGCDYCQGYFYSKPLTHAQLMDYVKDLRNDRAAS